ncbi:hypothetical protein [Clostridium intestinale]|uniref:Uncharacterized protein n=1 Tax=Clostridium intestinale DSM 6191 TaxID=1121320 RepID=A0A1M5YHM4_9CLOT|nr:hypothetical protein [Clostridium intestinale]SHI11472.1 hypothetical protein SAMN02745941_02003 [Clostridium intestinale DSM 6191]
MNKIVGLIGCSLQAAGVILSVLDVATWISVLVSLTGIGAAAGAVVISYRAAIMAVAKAAGKEAAKAM